MNRDRDGHFHFASLQGELGQKLRRTYEVNPLDDSVLLVDRDQIYTKSTAALRICRNLKGGVQLLSLFLFVPKSIRDAAYDVVARNRFRWFGHPKHCKLPTKEERRRLLD
ncbi:hypothetical protein KP78_19800 [Jeotgalibacillus soli]|uniref:Thiol-disulfide oxidoreductase n=2 Tax=Jeotgalibacillus soli TaxID=889306 RepID=A0A0C2VMG7_9BACL|nr:hypothetical protein KP78_19800 [Jeotgalibacillus soli]